MTTSLFTPPWTALASGVLPDSFIYFMIGLGIFGLASFVTMVYGLLHIFAGGDRKFGVRLVICPFALALGFYVLIQIWDCFRPASG